MKLSDTPRADVEIAINAPVEKVWPLISDPDLPAKFPKSFKVQYGLTVPRQVSVQNLKVQTKWVKECGTPLQPSQISQSMKFLSGPSKISITQYRFGHFDCLLTMTRHC